MVEIMLWCSGAGGHLQYVLAYLVTQSDQLVQISDPSCARSIPAGGGAIFTTCAGLLGSPRTGNSRYLKPGN